MNNNCKDSDDYRIASENINRSFLVSASAGTGKTRVLVDRYINILKMSNARIDDILAITFTEKAANEMKERIRRSLRYSASVDSNIDKNILDELSSAPISTIHSFCARVLQENIESIGIDPQFRIIDEIEESILRKDSLSVFLHEELNRPDSPIRKLIEELDLYQIREMLDIAWKQQVDLVIPFNKTTGKSESDVFEYFENHYKKNTINQLQEAFLFPGSDKIYEFIKNHNAKSPDDSLQQAKTSILNVITQIKSGQIPGELANGELDKVFSLKGTGRKENWGDELEEMREYQRQIRGIWDGIKDRVFPFDDNIERLSARLTIQFSDLALHWIDYYRNLLNEKSVVDFNGLEIFTENFLKSGSESAVKYAQRYKHLLVDEFQDISPVQNRILTVLSQLNPGMVTFFVGDEKQSIYRFRGAEVEIFNEYKRQKQLLYLDKNYRSIRPLNEFFNCFFTSLMNSMNCSAEYDVCYEKPVESHDQTLLKDFPAELLILNNVDESADESGLSDIDTEYMHIVQRMKELLEREIVKDRLSGNIRKPEWRDFTILLRSRTHQENLERILNLAGIPYYVSSGIGFYQRREVQDVINFMRVLINWYDESALVGTLRSPMVGMSDDDLIELTTEKGLGDGIQLYLADNDFRRQINPQVYQRFDTFLELYNGLQKEMAFQTTAELIQAILQKTYYLPVLAAFPEEKQSIANVLKLVDLAVEWGGSHDISPVDYIRRIQLYQSMQVREGDANLSSERENSVTIMTIHAAKGLAFPIVVIPELSAKSRTSHKRLLSDNHENIAFNLKTVFDDRHSYYHRFLAKCEKDRETAEEKRILYVAATRAESFLLLSGTDKSTSNPDSQWSKIRDIFNSLNLNAREVSKSELFANFQIQSGNIQKPISQIDENKRQEFSDLIQPLPVYDKIEKVTPTAFSGWVSRQKGQVPTFEKYHPKDLFDQSGSLPALEVGTIIHQAFSWWNFKDVDELTEFTAQLLRPDALESAEFQKQQTIFQKWGEQLIQPDNNLFRYIHEARTIFREVDVYAWIEETLIEGKIDLLLQMNDDRYMIVDFKSDRVDEILDETMLTKYNAQLNLYALILSQNPGIKVAKTGLYFIRNGLLKEQDITSEVIAETRRSLADYIHK